MNENIGLLEIYNIYKKYMKYILSFTFSVISISIIYSIFATPLYKSYISIYPASYDSNTTLSSFENIASRVGFNLPGSESSTFNIPDIINSRKLKKIITSKKWGSNLYNNPISLIEYWDFNDKDDFTYNHAQNEAIELLSSRMTTYEHDSGMITISILMEDQLLAANIVNFISDWIQNYISHEMTTQATKNRVFIQNQLDDAKKELFMSEEKLSEFQKNHSIADDNPEVFLKRTRLMRNIEVNQQVYITLKQQFELNKIEELKEKPIINILDEGDPATEKSKPLRTLIVLMSGISSFFVSFLFVYCYDGIVRNSNKA